MAVDTSLDSQGKGCEVGGVGSCVDELLARADVSALIPQYDSKAEEWWAAWGEWLIGSEVEGEVVETYYHPLTFHLAGESYTPDFLHLLADGRLVLVEIKGSTKQKGYRDARSKLRAAAVMYPWVTWYEALVGRGGWEKLERIR